MFLLAKANLATKSLRFSGFNPLSLKVATHRNLRIPCLRLCSSKMAAPSGEEFVRLTEAEKRSFDTSITLKAIKIPKNECNMFLKTMSKYLLSRPRLRKVEKCKEDDDFRLLLLDENLDEAAFSECMFTAMDDTTSTKSIKELLDDEKYELTEHNLCLGYDDLTTTEIFKRYLPDGAEIPSSFESVGHIAHLNLRDAALPFKYLIGQVILDKNPIIKTVVNKVGTITSEYRVFDMEVLAGKDETITEVRQHGLRFRLDFRKVYWNSRLENEHTRLVDTWIKKDDIVVDAMAGIGPFAIPAAKKGATVYANDLNPDSYHWLVQNSKLNKVNLHSFNEDAREFLRKAANGTLEGDDGQPIKHTFNHIIMNLPATAIEFLDALKGSFSFEMWDEHEMPYVHVYSFLPATETFIDLQKRIEHHLGGTLDEKPEFHVVRDVSPGKAMICSTFRVPRKIAFQNVNYSVDKKARTS